MSADTIVDVLSKSAGSFSLRSLTEALLTLGVCLLLTKGTVKLMRRLLRRTRLEKRMQEFLLNALSFLLYLVSAVITIQALGVNMSSFVALLSVFSLGIALAAEDILGNIAGGLVILYAHPFSIGDFIESDSILGTVDFLGLNHTRLLNPDGQYILIPNKDLAASRIINYTALGRRRVTVKTGVSYDDATEDVMNACYDAVARTDKVLSDPAPAVWVTDFGASAVEFTTFCWTLPGDYWEVLCTLRANVRAVFNERGINISYDHLNVHILDTPSAETITGRGGKAG